MSQTTDFYVSWLGFQGLGNAGLRFRDEEPIIFRPTDISGCAIWMDANNSDSVSYTELLEVISWSNLGYLGGSFSNTSNTEVFYGAQLQNGLRTVTCSSNSWLAGTFALDFQARSIFIVTRETLQQVGGSNANPLFTSDTSNSMEIFSLVNGQNLYFLGKHPSPIPEIAFDASQNYLNTAVLVEFLNGTDLSDNWCGVNGRQFPTIFDAVASGYNTSNATYYLGSFFGGSPTPTSQDICEIIIYNKALDPFLRQQVEYYLKIKWNIQEPPPPPPPPFVPSDIAGLQLWLDANQAVSLSNVNDVTSWSNVGAVGDVYTPACNAVTLEVDKDSKKWIEIATGAKLDSYSSLPYLSRTTFAVFQNLLSDYSTTSYPYLNLHVGNASGGRQIGLAYDSNTSNFSMAMCQNGYNCPVAGNLPVPLGTGDTNIVIYRTDSNTYTSSLGYFNGGSNLNTSTDLGNLFNTFPIPWEIGNASFDAPSFRVGEIIEYDSVLDAGQISTVAQYLVEKWAISSFTTIV